MALRLLLDTGFWFALYDPRDTYHKEALEEIRTPSKSHRSLSLVDAVLRLVLVDRNVKIDALITFNPGDFSDICQRSGIEVFP
ncbi:MAG: hypothetical protein U5L00_11175 [Desulfovermiculus sp.]|nr:hypothetical protein [Desulfovermiculus sp.]